MKSWTGRVLAAAFLVVCALGLRAQVPGEGWERIGLAYSGNITALAVSPDYEADGTVFIGVRGAGLWRTVDRGVSWVQCTAVPPTYTVTGIALARNYTYGGSKSLWAVTSESFAYRSDDSGATVVYQKNFLTQVGAPAPCTSVVMAGVSSWDGRVYVGTSGGGVFQNLNWGAAPDWQFCSSQLFDIRALSISGPSTQNLYAAAVTSSAPTVYRYTWNLEWQAVGTLGASGEETTALHASWEDPTVLWAGTKANGMWRCANPATSPSWAAACDGIVGAQAVPRVGAIASCPDLTNDDEVWEGRADGMRASTDRGTTCAPRQPFGPVTAIAFTPGYHRGGAFCHVYVGTEAGLYLITCASLPRGTGPVTIDGQAVALGHLGKGAYMGSASRGLFKSVDNGTMVQFNAFPNGQVPDIRAICMAPPFVETGACGTDEATLFVAANFADTAASGVYRSTDFGNSWTKVSAGWPTQTPHPVLRDLAISPAFQGGGFDRTLYAATDRGLYRYSNPTGGGYTWTAVYPEVPIEKVAVPPTYSISGPAGMPYHTVFISRGSLGAYYNTNDGADGNWTKLGQGGSFVPANVTGFAFPSNFFLSGPGTPSTRLLLSSSTQGVLASIYSVTAGGWTTWITQNTGLPGGLNVLDIAADPDYVSNTTVVQPRLLCAVGSPSSPSASDNGVYFTGNGGGNWALVQQGRALSLAWELPTTTGDEVAALAGFQNHLTLPGGAFFNHTSSPAFDWIGGYRSLPDDIWITRPYARDNAYLLATSPTYGVFLSRDKGETFRPYNGPGCTPLNYGALGFANGFARYANDPSGWTIDALYAGTACDGIWYRRIEADEAGTPRYAGRMDLQPWEACTLNGGGFSGPVQKIENLTDGNGGEAIWASSKTRSGCGTSGLGQILCPADSATNFIQSNTGLPGLEATSVRFGGSASLTDGLGVTGSVVQGDWNYYTFYVPPGAVHLVVALTGMDNDADLYVRYVARPTLALFDYRPYAGGTTDEVVDVLATTTPQPLAPGVWHIGVRGYAAGVTNYTLTASLLATVTKEAELSVAPAPKTTPPPPRAEGLIPRKPDAPSSGTIWGTVSYSGVFKGVDGGFFSGAAPEAIVWSARNGAAPTALDTAAHTTQVVIQLSDDTLLAGQGGALWHSPAPDEGLTTWWDFSYRLSGTSLDVRDFLECSNGDLLAALNGDAGSGGVWLSGSQGRYWMNLSSGFDAASQRLESLVSTAPLSGEVRYYTGTDTTGTYARTITPQPFPTVSGVNPASGDAVGGTSVTVTGTGFSAACPTGVPGDCQLAAPVVLFDETPVAGTWVSATQISAVTPPHGVGTARVRVVNPDSRMGTWVSTFSFTGTDPYALLVTRPGGVVIHLDWASAATVTVQRATDPGFTQNLVTAVMTGSTWDDTSAAVADGTTYYYRIR